MHIRTYVKGAALGAAAAYLFDPVSGNGRRARLRDQAGAAIRRRRERIDDLSRHASNVVQGAIHEVAGTGSTDRPMDDATVADRIRSEVLGRGELADADVVVNVEDGVAVLRGEAPTNTAIVEIVDLTAAVDGVREVQDLMHLPGQPAPNKQAARTLGS
jgi:osmotically-inducible protein OsmY